METKICTKCHEEKPIDNFAKEKKNKDGYRYDCKKCQKEYRKKYHQNNKEKVKIYSLGYRNNPDVKERLKIYNKEYNLNPNNKENKRKRDKKYYNNPVNKKKINIRNREYNKNMTDEQKEKEKIRKIKYRNNPINKEKIIEYRNNPIVKEKAINHAREYQKNNKERRNTNFKNRLNTEPIFKVKNSIRGSILKSIKNKGFTKKSRSYEILGCSYEDFKLHLENQFQDWMNWDNYGKYEKEKFNIGWDIDHIIPLKTATTEEDVIRLNHYTNLQPLCSKFNRDVKR